MPQVEAFLPPPVNRQVISTMNIITTRPKPFKTDKKCHGHRVRIKGQVSRPGVDGPVLKKKFNVQGSNLPFTP
ncbi:hypothetical protein NGA_0137000 [Nannochloropsis gaditana CCMP526]|uniref:uncharacterized protein n=1 Tax=Nannochloropsis gaditana (strain CCMP526) TaxID=1093141 RepID=UPI00029F7DED|nr:hypothetical protein NGA_0137000 [Nannochloropsis gaditana CCMP526]EKU21031.1 hypothetical protein NGA_0137000 [Nannochloropsis gaditana CCMP526]|eukprot:XP_005855326.1 hypothetical protein NGA_0137000 [Nannochloropsis gaditana CCMP526]